MKVTAEVLREIKTVRQFAMEDEETSNYSRSGLGRHLMVQVRNFEIDLGFASQFSDPGCAGAPFEPMYFSTA